MKGFEKVLFLCIIVVFAGCSSTSKTSSSASGNDAVDVGYGNQDKEAVTNAITKLEVDNPALSLADYLRRVPGVMVRGSGNNVTVMIRMGSSYGATSGPLFVLDGVQIGTSYDQAVNMVDVNDIKDISVLKDISSSNIYGYQAKNGVILIESKRGN